MRALGAGYASEVDTVDERTWCHMLRQFDDAIICQTWSYDAVRCVREKISHLVLKEGGEIAAIAQCRIVKPPIIDAGIAYVRWGPLWRRRGIGAPVGTFRQAIRALRNEYACKRGLVVRVYPLLFDDGSSDFVSILREEGFSWLGKERRERTLLIDLSRPIEELRASLRPHWRRQLKSAERNGLEILEGSGDELFEMFTEIYRETVSRKGFLRPDDFGDFRSIQARLPDELKMRIMLCRSGQDVCAGLVCSAIGSTGIYLFGATSNSGLKSRGSYLLHWKLVEWLKHNRFAVYDLNGINPVTNPGTYRFKNDMCGEHGRDVAFFGRFESSANALSSSFVACGETLRTTYRALRRAFAERAAAWVVG